jgi:hypothetical protein
VVRRWAEKGLGMKWREEIRILFPTPN